VTICRIDNAKLIVPPYNLHLDHAVESKIQVMHKNGGWGKWTNGVTPATKESYILAIPPKAFGDNDFTETEEGNQYKIEWKA